MATWVMESFTAKLGTKFRYRSDLQDAIYIQIENRSGVAVSYVGNIITTIQVPAEDLLEFVARVSDVPQSAEGMGVAAAAYVMDQLRVIGLFNAVSAETENKAREMFCKLFSGERPDAPLDDYDRQTKELATAHVAGCRSCDEINRCPDYWKVMLARARAKSRRLVQ